MPRLVHACLLVAVLALAGCAAHPAAATAPAPAAPASSATTPTPTVVLPPAHGRFDYQLGGAYAPASSVQIVGRDRAEPPVAGVYSICYINAFQTQPDEAAGWRREHPELLLRRHGRLVTDPGWPGEYLLDTSTKAKRRELATIVGGWITDCAARGYAAVEPDNLDSWTRSRGLLTQTDDLALAGMLTKTAHAAGLAVAQKNSSELGSAARTRWGFDFAIAEECEVYGECGAYTDVYGAHVLEVEYADQSKSAYTRACRARGATISVIRRDRDVVPRGAKGYVYRHC